MLQTMVYGGSLGDSLFSNVSISRMMICRVGSNKILPGDCGIAISSNAVWIQGLGTLTSLLRLCNSGWMRPKSALWKLVPAHLSVSRLSEYIDSAECQLYHLGIRHLRYLGLPSRDGWRLHQGLTQPAITSESSQWEKPTYWGMLCDFVFLKAKLTILPQNDVNEGAPFTQQNITTEDDLVDWLHLQFPLFTNDDIAKVLLYYPSTNATDNPMAPKYATSGTTGATALNESQIGAGQQQRADVSLANCAVIPFQSRAAI